MPTPASPLTAGGVGISIRVRSHSTMLPQQQHSTPPPHATAAAGAGAAAATGSATPPTPGTANSSSNGHSSSNNGIGHRALSFGAGAAIVAGSMGGGGGGGGGGAGGSSSSMTVSVPLKVYVPHARVRALEHASSSSPRLGVGQGTLQLSLPTTPNRSSPSPSPQSSPPQPQHTPHYLHTASFNALELHPESSASGSVVGTHKMNHGGSGTPPSPFTTTTGRARNGSNNSPVRTRPLQSSLSFTSSSPFAAAGTGTTAAGGTITPSRWNDAERKASPELTQFTIAASSSVASVPAPSPSMSSSASFSSAFGNRAPATAVSDVALVPATPNPLLLVEEDDDDAQQHQELDKQFMFVEFGSTPAPVAIVRGNSGGLGLGSVKSANTNSNSKPTAVAGTSSLSRTRMAAASIFASTHNNTPPPTVSYMPSSTPAIDEPSPSHDAGEIGQKRARPAANSLSVAVTVISDQQQQPPPLLRPASSKKRSISSVAPAPAPAPAPVGTPVPFAITAGAAVAAAATARSSVSNNTATRDASSSLRVVSFAVSPAAPPATQGGWVSSSVSNHQNKGKKATTPAAAEQEMMTLRVLSPTNGAYQEEIASPSHLKLNSPSSSSNAFSSSSSFSIPPPAHSATKPAAPAPTAHAGFVAVHSHHVLDESDGEGDEEEVVTCFCLRPKRKVVPRRFPTDEEIARVPSKASRVRAAARAATLALAAQREARAAALEANIAAAAAASAAAAAASSSASPTSATSSSSSSSDSGSPSPAAADFSLVTLADPLPLPAPVADPWDRALGADFVLDSTPEIEAYGFVHGLLDCWVWVLRVVGVIRGAYHAAQLPLLSGLHFADAGLDVATLVFWTIDPSMAHHPHRWRFVSAAAVFIMLPVLIAMVHDISHPPRSSSSPSSPSSSSSVSSAPNDAKSNNNAAVTPHPSHHTAAQESGGGDEPSRTSISWVGLSALLLLDLLQLRGFWECVLIHRSYISSSAAAAAAVAAPAPPAVVLPSSPTTSPPSSSGGPPPPLPTLSPAATLPPSIPPRVVSRTIESAEMQSAHLTRVILECVPMLMLQAGALALQYDARASGDDTSSDDDALQVPPAPWELILVLSVFSSLLCVSATVYRFVTAGNLEWRLKAGASGLLYMFLILLLHPAHKLLTLVMILLMYEWWSMVVVACISLLFTGAGCVWADWVSPLRRANVSTPSLVARTWLLVAPLEQLTGGIGAWDLVGATCAPIRTHEGRGMANRWAREYFWLHAWTALEGLAIAALYATRGHLWVGPAVAITSACIIGRVLALAFLLPRVNE